MSVYISEVDYDGGAGSNFVEVVAPSATDVSGYSLVVYDKDGAIIETLSFGAPVNTIAGKNVYLFDDNDPDFPDIHNDEALALVDDQGNVVQFISFKDPVTAVEGPADGQSSTPVGEHSGADESLQSSNGGASYATTESSDPGLVPCYAPHTLIDTPNGPRAVETLAVGDLVNTIDHGPQIIRWVHSGDYPLEKVEADAKPVLIAAGALGKGLPAQDLIVSPQHRILVGGGGQLDGWFKTESFAPAKSLTAMPGIRHMKGKQSITWIHFACDRHEVITANGCLSESLLLGPKAVKGLTYSERRELAAIYGSPDTRDTALNGAAARDCRTVGEVRRRIVKGKKEKRRFFAKEIKKWDVDLEMEQWETVRSEFTLSESQKPNLRLVS